MMDASGLSMAWLAHHPLAAAWILASVQVALLTLLAGVLARVCRHYAALRYSIWLAAVLLVLPLLPAHLLVGGWTLTIAEPVAAAVDRTALQSPLEQTVITGNADAGFTQASQTPGTQRSDALSLQTAAESEVNALSSVPGTQAVRQPLDQAARSAFHPRQEMVRREQKSSLLWFALAAVYWLGTLVLVLKMFTGAMRLKRLAASGRELGEQAQRLLRSASEQITLARIPVAKVCPDLSMPLTHGLWQASVLLPADFESWPVGQQRSVLLHELAHIERRDTLGLFASRVMRAMYWFHPACWMIDRQLEVARELATDERVLRCGIPRSSYAQDLVAVIERLSERTCMRAKPFTGAVSMSANAADFEDRVLQILVSDSTRPVTSRLRQRCFIAAMVCLVLATTIRLKLVDAPAALASSPVAASEGHDDARTATQSDANTPAQNDAKAAAVADQASSDSFDLFHRVRDCEVLTVSGDRHGPVLTVSGQVLSADGTPAAGAIVVLRESSTSRISSQPTDFIERKDREIFRTRDVIARTVTGDDGAFRFENVKTPALPDHYTNSWRGDVVAAHPQLGLGNVPLSSRQRGGQIVQQVTLALRPSTTISGRLVKPDQTPLADADVVIAKIDPSDLNQDWQADGYIDLQASQLAPQAKTNAQGEFVFKNIPQGGVALVLGHHPAWKNAAAYVATSNDVPLGQRSTRLEVSTTVVASPVTLVADPGVAFSGKVLDEDNQPIAGAKVWWSSGVERAESDAEGAFRLRLSTKLIEWARRESALPLKLLVIAPKDSRYLTRNVELAKDDLADLKPLIIHLERGVRVSGKVLTDGGKAAAALRVVPLGEAAMSGGVTNDAGEYELLAPKRKVTLLVGTDGPGYQLPTRRELMQPTDEQVKAWPQLTVDLSDGVDRAVDPITVAMLKALDVSVSLPDGRPAAGASVVIKDSRSVPSSNGPPGGPFPTLPEEISPHVATDAQGRASLLPKGVPSEAAYAEVRLVTPNGSWFGSALLKDAKERELPVVVHQSWTIKGRVLLDGQPAVGATVSIAQAQPFTRRVGTWTGTGATLTNHITAMADKDGWYQAAVPAGQQYSVHISSVPGLDSRIGIGFSPEPAADGILRVKDFALMRANGEIAGSVVDIDGKPVAGARGRIYRTATAMPELWVGHQGESQSTTDAQGRFHLRRVPEGMHQIEASTPFVAGKASSNAMVEAKTGELNVQVTLANQ